MNAQAKKNNNNNCNVFEMYSYRKLTKHENILWLGMFKVSFLYIGKIRRDAWSDKFHLGES